MFNKKEIKTLKALGFEYSNNYGIAVWRKGPAAISRDAMGDGIIEVSWNDEFCVEEVETIEDALELLNEWREEYGNEE